jgi:hypothetical protein
MVFEIVTLVVDSQVNYSLREWKIVNFVRILLLSGCPLCHL